MATARQFEDLQVWQDARELVREIYKVTKQRAFRRDFSLRDTSRSAALNL
jgi:23S rRNA-intervening sequence protein